MFGMLTLMLIGIFGLPTRRPGRGRPELCARSQSAILLTLKSELAPQVISSVIAEGASRAPAVGATQIITATNHGMPGKLPDVSPFKEQGESRK
jgi:hypothetical protein